MTNGGMGPRVLGVPLRFGGLLAALALTALGFPNGVHARERAIVPHGILRGRVLALPDSQEVGKADVTVVSASYPSSGLGRDHAPAPRIRMDVRTDSRGRFEIVLEPGRYGIDAKAFGFSEGSVGSVDVSEGETTEVAVFLEAVPFSLEGIVVTPSTYGILGNEIMAGPVLTREEVRTMPHFGEDIFRSVDRLPGVATHDVTAKLQVRGAPSRETLTVLDGLELYEPYHLKDWDGALSIIDVESVDKVDIATGGFSAEFGDRSAGVFAMETDRIPPPRRGTALGFSLMNLTFKTEGGFADGAGSYLVSARRGFLDLLFALTGEDEGVHSFIAQEGDSQETRKAIPGELNPVYSDVFARAQYEIRPGHRLSLDLLHAGDDMNGVEEDSTRYNHGYGSSYAWVGWDAEFSRRLSARTIVSLGRVSRDRNGGDYATEIGEQDPERTLEVRDEATFDLVGLKQDWTYRLSNRLLFKGGFDLKQGSADYDYFRWRREVVPNPTDPMAPAFSVRWDTLSLALSRVGTETGAYAAGRFRPLRRLTAEIGLRWDSQSHTGEWQVAPRVSGAYLLTARTTLRGAWGYYHQSQGLEELWTSDGDTTYYPAQRAEHRVLGLEHQLTSGVTVRVEGYQRRVTDPLPDYRSLIPRIEGLREEDPEYRRFVDPDQAEARGVELLVRSAGVGNLLWSASYALTVSEEALDGRWWPRPMDQRHGVQLQVAYRPSSAWSFGASWTYHSPWPYTGETFEVVPLVSGASYVEGAFGPINGERLPSYHRLDARLSRRFQVKRGEITAFFDVFNLYNRKNALAIAYYPLASASGLVSVEKEYQDQLGVMPTFGLRWSF